jgi:hypothetical protein
MLLRRIIHLCTNFLHLAFEINWLDEPIISTRPRSFRYQIEIELPNELRYGLGNLQQANVFTNTRARALTKL